MTQQELREELRQDLLREARLENLYHNNYEAFLEHYEDIMLSAAEALKNVEQLHKEYGHPFDCSILNEYT